MAKNSLVTLKVSLGVQSTKRPSLVRGGDCYPRDVQVTTSMASNVGSALSKNISSGEDISFKPLKVPNHFDAIFKPSMSFSTSNVESVLEFFWVVVQLQTSVHTFAFSGAQNLQLIFPFVIGVLTRQ